MVPRNPPPRVAPRRAPNRSTVEWIRHAQARPVTTRGSFEIHAGPKGAALCPDMFRTMTNSI